MTKLYFKTSAYSALLFPFVLAYCPSAIAGDNDFWKDLTLSANTTLVSDYRFRGVSQSDEDLAIQGGLDISHASGFYVSAWGSSINDFNGSETELDLYGGWSGPLGDLTVDVGAIGYIYPGGSGNDYWEVYASLNGSFSDTVGWTIGSYYAPEQDNVGDNDNIYVYSTVNAEIPDTIFSVYGTLGVQDGGFGASDGSARIDWQAGVSAQLDKFSLSIAYADTDERSDITDAAVIVSLGASF